MENSLIIIGATLLTLFTSIAFILFKKALKKGDGNGVVQMLTLSVIRLLTLFLVFIILRERYDLYFFVATLFGTFILSVVTELIIYKRMFKGN